MKKIIKDIISILTVILLVNILSFFIFSSLNFRIMLVYIRYLVIITQQVNSGSYVGAYYPFAKKECVTMRGVFLGCERIRDEG